MGKDGSISSTVQAAKVPYTCGCLVSLELPYRLIKYLLISYCYKSPAQNIFLHIYTIKTNIGWPVLLKTIKGLNFVYSSKFVSFVLN